jgi:Integral membrane protein TerC family
VVLIGGGAFLIVKGTMETHHMLEGHEEEHSIGTVTFASAVVQIIFLDVVFAPDSIITAVGMVEHLWVMVVAVVIAMIIMLVAADPVGNFVNNHPTVKMLALSFLLLVGVALVADGLHFHIPRGYLAEHGIVCSMSRKGNCWEPVRASEANMPRWKVFSTHWKPNWCIIAIARPATKPDTTFSNSSKSSTIASGVIRLWATLARSSLKSPPWRRELTTVSVGAVLPHFACKARKWNWSSFGRSNI